MVGEKRKLTVSELVAEVLPCIEEKGYSEVYLKGFRSDFKKLLTYCTEHDENYFTAELGQQFLHDRYGIAPGTYELRCSRQIRAMDLLSDYQHFGTVMLKRRLNRQFPVQFQNSVEQYLHRLKNNGRRDNTIISHKKSLYKLTDFLDSCGVSAVEQIRLDHIDRYINVILCNYSKTIVQLHLGITRTFLKYLYDSGQIGMDLSSQMLYVKYTKSTAHLPSTFTKEQIHAILATVDRESPQGKRDYAVLLLAAKLGMRTSDIRNLKPGNIDWERHTISFVQTKTREPLTLPLPTDVGWAIIDYLRNGRPKSDAPEIFLRCVAPYISLNNFDNILVKHMRKAGIPLNTTRHHGLHTLRHSLATHMLDEGIPITSIQSVLGHVSGETTKQYIGVSVRQLRDCSLEVTD